MVSQSHKNRNSQAGEPIAIIGTGCRFPGESSSSSKLWDLLRNPRDLRSEISSRRFDPDGFFHVDNFHHGTSNVRHSYLLSEDHRLFDAQFFGIKPIEASSIDPQQRLLLETVYESLESAGLKVDELRGSQTAVYVGLMCGDYADILNRDPDAFPTYISTGTARSIMSNRISYFFDWHGPCMTIDTACSSSLVAVHQAVQTLRSKQSRIAIAAGSNLCLAPEPYIAESKLKMLSPNGQSRMWDAAADGYARGDGVASVVLKTLSAALEDGDHIECLIRETGVNQDGRTPGITMPSAKAQYQLIQDTYAMAGLDVKADRCQYFEAHGTGTPAGDPIEAEAICSAFFGKEYTSHEKLYVGSIKTVIGHTEGTAGLAAILKASLALQHAIIPPNLLFDNLNPAIQPFYNNLKVPTKAMPWPSLPPGSPRRASVNSFGFGGTNAHAILESFEPPEPQNQPLPQSTLVLAPFKFSAASEQALVSNLSAYSSYLATNSSVDLRDLAWTLNSRRSSLAVRTTLPGTTVEQLRSNIASKLNDIENKDTVVGVRPKSLSGLKPKLLGIFTGQGAQWARMGKELIQRVTAARNTIKHLDQCLSELPDGPSWSIEAELLADESSSRIQEATLSQPLCTAIQITLVLLLRVAGVEFDAVVGHSSGEIGAAYAAGYYSAKDAIRVAYYRGLHSRLAVGDNDAKGAMMAIGTSLQDACELCNEFDGRMCVAAVNSASSITLSGDFDAITQAKQVLDDEKKFARILSVDKAYHSYHMNPASEAYLTSLKACDIKVQHPTKSNTAWFSSVRDEQMKPDSDGLACEYWNDNLVSPVLFSQAVECATAAKGPFTMALEVGPHPALKGPVVQVTQDLIEQNIPYAGLLQRKRDDIEAIQDGLGFLWTHGYNVNFEGLQGLVGGVSKPRILKDLPAYAWDHERLFWLESRLSRVRRTRNKAVHQLLGSETPDKVDRQFRWRNFLSPREVPWISGHQIQGQMVFPGAGYFVTAVEAVQAMSPDQNIRLLELEHFKIEQALTFEGIDSSVEVLISVTDIIHNEMSFQANFSYFSALGNDPTGLTLNASARLHVVYGALDDDVLPKQTRLPVVETIDVPDGRFYEVLASLGYGYTGPFRALTSMKRSLGTATGHIIRPVDEASGPLIIHPAAVDAAIQSVMLAKSWPGDGRLWCVHVPTVIDRIAINPTACGDPKSNRDFYFFQTVLDDQVKSGICGDVGIYSEDGGTAVIQIQGIHAVPLDAATLANDCQLFSSMVWDTAFPDGEAVAHDGRATQEDIELANILERAAHFYLKQFDEVIPQQHSSRKNGPYVGLLNYAKHISSTVAAGTHSYAKAEWLHDTEETILVQASRYPDNIDLKIMHIIGTHMPEVIKGQANILEYLRKDDLLDDYYSQALGISYYTEYLARMAAQIVHRYPHMHILEIGAGTGAATKRVMDHIGETYSSYTFSDISNGFFEKARGVFKDKKRVSYKVLNIEEDISSQGFSPASFDLVIASFVLHATARLEQTLRNVRALLKPGGMLLMLEVTNLKQTRLGYIFGALPGWWLGEEDNRKLSPCVTPAEWDTVLRKTGFSGIDSKTPDLDPLPFPASAFVSTALDTEIEFLRSPLLNLNGLSSSDRSIKQLVILGGDLTMFPSISSTIGKLLHDCCADLLQFNGWEDVLTDLISPSATVLNLVDLERPTFRALTSAALEGIKAIFGKVKRVLWITRGCRDENPYHNQSVGFGRAMLVEMPHVRSQFMDLDRLDDSSAALIAEALLRFMAMEESHKNLLWTTEPEFCIRNGKCIIPRIKLNRPQNDRYNSMRRSIVNEVDTTSNVAILHAAGENYQLREGQSIRSMMSSQKYAHVVVKVALSIPIAIRITKSSFLYLISGTSLKSSGAVLALSTTHASHVEVPERWTIPCENYKDQKSLLAIFYHLVSISMLDQISEGEQGIVLDLEPALANFLRYQAKRKAISLTFLTSTFDATDPSFTHVHEKANIRDIRQILPRGASFFISTSAKGISSRILELLPPSCRHETLSSILGRESSLNPSALGTVVGSLLRASLNFTPSLLGSLNADVLMAHSKDLSSLITATSALCIIDWRSSTRVLAEIEPVHEKRLLSGDKTYWLVGLTGSLGVSLCRWMIARGAKNIVFTSRNPKIDPAEIAEFKRAGATVSVFSGDITDRRNLHTIYDRICQTHPPIAGVAQGAMVLRDTLINDMDTETMNSVLKPKVDGSRYLDELFSENTLDFFIFFSSATCVTGNLGQSNYSVANMFMVGLAAQRRKRGLAGSVINIGAILGVGYVTRETSQALQDNLLKSGHVWMSEEDFHTIFAEAILAGRPDSGLEPEIVTGLRIIYDTDKQRPLWSFNPKFQHLVMHADGTASDATKASGQKSMRTQLREAGSIVEAEISVQAAVVTKLQSMLQLEDAIDQQSVLDLTADSLGIDSLNAVEIRSWFNQELDVDLPVLLILGGSTIRDLVGQVMKKLPEAISSTIGSETKSATERDFKSKRNEVEKLPKIKDIPRAADAIAKIDNVDSRLDALQSWLEPIQPADIVRKTQSGPQLQTLDTVTETETPPKSESDPPSTAMVSSAELISSKSEASSFDIVTPPRSIDAEFVPNADKELPIESSSKLPSSSPNILRTEALSFGQARFWFLKSYIEDQTTFNITCSMALYGQLRVDDLEAAVRVVGQRHEALRTCFIMNEEQKRPIQGVLQTSLLQLEKKKVIDLEEIDETVKDVSQYIYDIEGGRTMRIILLSLEPVVGSTRPSSPRHQIIIGYHHINMDGISLQVFLSDLEKAYSRRPMPSRILQYPDFSSRQHQQHNRGDWKKDLDFWRNEFPKSSLTHTMPIMPVSEVRSRHPLTRYEHHRVDFRLDMELTNQIRKICRRSKITPYHFFLATFKTLLFRMSGADDVVIGVADGNRVESDTLESIGFYLNLLPLRFQKIKAQSFLEAIKEARVKAYSAMAHSRVPFDVLLNELDVPRSTTHNPLFQAFLDYRQEIDEKRNFGDCRLEGQQYESGRTSYDIVLDVVDSTASQPLLMLAVQTSLYSHEAGETLKKAFVNLLREFSKDPSQRLDHPPLFDPDEIDKALTLGRGPNFSSQWPQTLAHRVDDIAQRLGQNIALKDGSAKSFTYEQMFQRVEAIASSLAQAHVGEGSNIGVFQNPSSDWICSLLAIWRVGATYVPLDLQATIPRLRLIVNDCKPQLLLIDNTTSKDVSELIASGAAVINISGLEESTFAKSDVRASADQLAAILYTSGSTGIPKGIMLKHSSLRNSLEGHADGFNIGPGARMLQQIALSFDYSLWQIFLPLVSGATLVIAPQSSRGDPAALVDMIANEGITITGATPSEYVGWLRSSNAKRLRSSNWQTIVSGGEPVPETLKQELKILSKADLQLHNGYGPTEVTISSNITKISYSEGANVTDASHAIPVGFTAPNYSVYIVDDDLKLVPTGMAGQVLIGGAGVAAGYIHNDDLTAAKFVSDAFATPEYRKQGWTRAHLTGDRGRLRPDGTLVVEGRVNGDTQIKLRGLRIDLRDIETTILQSAGGVILESVVSLRTATASGPEFLVAHVLFSTDFPKHQQADFLQSLPMKLPLPHYMCPAIMIALDKIPTNSHWKLDRKAINALQLPKASRRNLDSLTVELSETESRLMEVWERVIPSELVFHHHITKDSDFFHVGGTSLLLIKLRGEINKTFDVDLPLVQLFEASNLQNMALRIQNTVTGTATSDIDWTQEAELPSGLFTTDLRYRPKAKSSRPKVVVLTGATGFLGNVLLQQLVRDRRIGKIHCVAVRNVAKKKPLLSEGKVVVHQGDLTQSHLGLPLDLAQALFNEADVVVHNGADVSFLKRYSSVKRANVDSTLDMLRLSIEAGIPFHYISTTGVAALTGQKEFGEASVNPNKDPSEEMEGYIASKWVSEQLVEKAAQRYGLPVIIHRPSNIVGEDAPSLDIMHNITKYSRKLKVVPIFSSWEGYLDFVTVDYTASRIIRAIIDSLGPETSSVKFLHHSGQVQVPLAKVRAHMEKQEGIVFRELPLAQWIKLAEDSGLDTLVAAYLRRLEVDHTKIILPRITQQSGGLLDPSGIVRRSLRHARSLASLV